MGLPAWRCESAVRLSIGLLTSEALVSAACDAIARCGQALAAMPLAVAVHRFILLRQPRPRLLEVRHFFLWLAGLGLAFLAARAFCLLLSAVSFVRGLTEFTVTIGAVIVALQIGLIFPAIATGVPAASMEQRIDSGFRMSEGRFLLLLRTIALTLIPLIILMVVLSRISGGPPPDSFACERGWPLSLARKSSRAALPQRPHN